MTSNRFAHRLMLAACLSLAVAGTGGALLFPRFSRQVPVGELPGGAAGALVSSNQMVTPAGTVKTLNSARPKDVALSPDGKTLAVLAQGRVVFFEAATGEKRGEARVEIGPLGLAWSPDGAAVYASLSNGRVAKVVPDGAAAWKQEATYTIDVVAPDGEPDVAAGTQGRGSAKGDPQVAGLAVSPDGRMLYVALGIRNAIAMLDLTTGKVVRSVAVGVAPYHLALSPDGRTLVVANRGGAPAKRGEPSAPSAGTPVRVDRRTDAAAGGSVSLLDTATGAVRATLAAGRQPSGIAVASDGTLYVASSDDDTLLVFRRGGGRPAVVPLRPKEDPGFGQIPTDVALSADGKRLYVACGGANAVAVVDAAEREVEGWVPTGWFPIALAERDGRVYVASTKGYGSRVKRANGSFGVHGTLGTVQFVAPDAFAKDTLPGHGRRVAENNRWGMSATPLTPRRDAKPVPVPERVGEPSVFKHVVFIIKENQTYDSLLGDMPEGNGDPKLCLFGEEVTPNHHALARQFVLLDNTFTSGTNSADGHQWTVSSVANGYIEQNYAAHSRSYPYDGGDPLAYSPEGFLWTSARAKNKSVRVYGEFVNKPRVFNRETGKTGGSWADIWADYQRGMKKYEITADTDNAALKPLLHPNYIGFPSSVPDQWRADQFIADVDRFEREGKMPDLCILLLPNDHTMGTRAGSPTPRATVADNDLALGRMVERLSKSKFWKEMLILVIEDDSQLGLDHVDGHRTTAFCISPYTKRAARVSNTYNHTSFLRTMGLVLGLPPMNRFDRTADPLTACFTATPDFTPYTHLKNRIPLDEMNPRPQALNHDPEAKRLAIASDRLDWSDVDRAHAETVARAVWHSRFPQRPFPMEHFHPNEGTDGDDE
ncbi:MAG TPA: bifunctional YncE family protein/alkaline phosphatase family protein [Armatimonadaceae bacterium]|nr:bifunctional YncE family protein/alkaline phosphatase family protein [Armatimonadaceae bacterium]